MRKNVGLGIFLVLPLFLLGCWNSLKIQEVFEGDDVWVRELIRGMEITAEYPQEIATNQPWEFVLRIENHGEHEPHLHTLWVEKITPAQADWTCQVIEPPVKKVQQGENWYLFFVESRKVRRNQVTTMRLQCTFEQAATYEILIGAEFAESGVDFFSKKVTLNVR